MNTKAFAGRFERGASRISSSADFQVCCIAGFQTRRLYTVGRRADLEIGDTADLKTCATTRRDRVAKPATVALAVFAAINCCFAQQRGEWLSDTNKIPASTNLTTQQDHRLRMELLGIKSLRP